MSLLMGIDPGTTESGYAIIDEEYSVRQAGKVPNEDLLKLISPWPDLMVDTIIVESMQNYGQVFGKSSIETCYFIGRVIQVALSAGIPYFLYPRPEYARAICGCTKISDAILRQAILNRFGGDTKGEPLNLLRGNSDKRSAFSVAVYHLDTLKYPK